jgi:hypothetical protein
MSTIKIDVEHLIADDEFEYKNYDSNNPDATVTIQVLDVLGLRDDLFGRPMWTIQAKRLDTGQEGTMSFGPNRQIEVTR